MYHFHTVFSDPRDASVPSRLPGCARRFGARLVLPLVVLGSLIADVASGQCVPDSAVVELELELAVYAAALNEIFAETPGDTMYVIEITESYLTLGDDVVLRSLRRMDDVSDEMIASYIGRNSERLSLSRERLAADRAVELTARPRGALTVTLSRVGFNAEMKEAILHVADHCGVRCGGGFIMRLSYVDGGWVVRDGMETFIL